MRIRGPALYKHIREHNILPLPSMSTIRRHCIGLKATYGFQNSLFEAMKFKGESMKDNEKRGKIISHLILFLNIYNCHRQPDA